jgi:hypothetical protein
MLPGVDERYFGFITERFLVQCANQRRDLHEVWPGTNDAR